MKEEKIFLLSMPADPGLVSKAKTISEAISIVIFFIGTLVLVGWKFDIAILKSILPFFRPMSPNAAAGLLLLGISLYFLQEKRLKKWTRNLGYGCALFAFILGLATLIEYVFGVDLLIDQVLFKDLAGSVLTIFPGRMGFAAAVSFMVLGPALLFLDVETKRGLRPSQFLAVAAGVISLVIIVGYINDVSSFYSGIAIYTAMAFHLAISFFIFHFGVLSARPDRGLFKVLVINSFSGSMVRRLLPLTFVVPLIFSWLVEYAEHKGLYGSQFNLVLNTSAVMIVFSLLILLSSVLLEYQEEEREKIERDLFKNEKKYHDLIDIMDEGYAIQDKNQILTFVSSRACKMLGYNLAEMVGKPTMSFFTKEDQEIFKQQMIKRRKGSRESYEIAWMRKNGEKLYTIITPRPILNEEGLYNGSVAVFTDITNRKMTEEKIKEEQLKLNALAKDLEKFKLAADSVLDQVMITDPDGTILYVNPATETITGYTAKETIKNNAGKLWGGNMPNSFYENMWNRIKEEKKPFVGEITNHRKILRQGSFVGEVTNYRKNGQPYIAEVRISPILGDNGQVQFFVGIERDITKIKEIDQIKSDFISFASHQLRTPLTVIKWNTEMLRSRDAGELTKEQKHYLTEIERGEKRMALLISFLLNISRLESERMKVEPKPVDVTALITDIIAELNPYTKAKNCSIIFNKPAQPMPLINIDPALFKQVVSNLLSNATHYSKPKKCKIEVDFKEVKGYYQIDVLDEGIGIPAAAQGKIFDKFFRADNAVQFDAEGTGLGLYMVKLIVEKNGGKVWFESTEGKGSVFHFTIPKTGMKKVDGEKGLAV